MTERFFLIFGIFFGIILIAILFIVIFRLMLIHSKSIKFTKNANRLQKGMLLDDAKKIMDKPPNIEEPPQYKWINNGNQQDQYITIFVEDGVILYIDTNCNG